METRLENERMHAHHLVTTNLENWGWHTKAGKIRRERRSIFLTDITFSTTANILEVGVGTGTFTRDLANKFSNLTAIDISQILIEHAKKSGIKANLFVMDAHDLSFPDNHFDGIVGCSILHHLDWDLALKSFIKKLKPGGRLRFSEPNLSNPQIFLQKNIPYLKKKMGDSPDEYAFTSNQIMKSLISAGFTNISVRPYEFLHPNTPEKLIKSVIKLEELLSKTFINKIAGSLFIEAEKPY